MNNIAIITARGGSKRIPRKNIRDFLGKPIMAYSIETAIKSGLFSKIMVSTDDDEIAHIARKYGAEVPFYRSPQTANDTATTINVIHEVIRKYAELGENYAYACCIYPTAPFITPSKLEAALDLILRKDADACFPVVRYSTPIQRAFSFDDSCFTKMLYPEFAATRSQDLVAAHYDAGQFYWLKTSAIKENLQILRMNAVGLLVNENEVHDIDEESDWQMAELKYKILKG